MRILQMLLGCLALLVVTIFAAQNTTTVTLQLFRFSSVRLPLGLVLMGALVAGICSAVVFVGIIGKRSRPIQAAVQSLSSSR